MDNPVLNSTFLLTMLMGIGMMFFIKASVKDRTEVVKLASNQSEELLLTALQKYFTQRSYTVTGLDRDKNQVTLEGLLSPSVFLAFLLSGMAGVGAVCLGIVLSYLLPVVPALGTVLPLGLPLVLMPLAARFYWKSARRVEQVSFQVEPGADQGRSLIKVRAHRDEVETLKQTLSLTRVD
jgi:Cofactor assembly of complex C subunit B